MAGKGDEMKKLVLRGRKVYGGVAEGYALVTKEALGGMGVFDASTGTVTENGNDWKGEVITGKVLVFKTGRGSSSWAACHQLLRFMGTAPVAHVFAENNPQTALGAVLLKIPAVTDLDQDPTEAISTGDWVKVDGDRGIVEVTKN
jgi:predicted aconitase with swiveling domain